ncbi:MAG: UDP-glucose 4-epimerase GalE [Betaproteobacteria bacterium]|nr:UDP-glucose 4-epimerase GalE [Betaproteobacteria bacterium]
MMISKPALDRGTVLVTGGTGYIGSHTCIALIEQGFRPVVVDNLCNSDPIVLDRIAAITGHRPAFHQADVRDERTIEEILRADRPIAAIHFAGLKAVGESVAQPLRYYANNVEGSVKLFGAMRRVGVKRIIFSSSATVYGDPDAVPIPESAPLRPTNPYGQTKAMVEQVLGDLHHADPAWSVGILRYFNPVGAHESGTMGEDPQGIPNNLMPYVAQVAVGRREALSVFGNDYPTPDGTGVRDYIHVMDLAEGHVAALAYVLGNEGVLTVNLGTGQGHSVLEMVHAFERASGRSVPSRIVGRRPGDIATCYAGTQRAAEVLGWRARRGLDAMCRDAWRWQRANPDGYAAGERAEADAAAQG